MTGEWGWFHAYFSIRSGYMSWCSGFGESDVLEQESCMVFIWNYCVDYALAAASVK